MKSLYTALVLISLLAFAQADDPTCTPSCEGTDDPAQCVKSLETLKECVQQSCDFTKIKQGDAQAALKCLIVCKPTDKSVYQAFNKYALCLFQNNQKVQQLKTCAQDSFLGCENNFQTCFTAAQNQVQCIQTKCTDITNADLNGIQTCVFKTCKSDSSVFYNLEQKIYQCVTEQKISVSAKLLISSVFTLIGYLFLF
ncbi:hypothetical protein ABPG72_014396 [Tetrahymena utriculariae]